MILEFEEKFWYFFHFWKDWCFSWWDRTKKKKFKQYIYIIDSICCNFLIISKNLRGLDYKKKSKNQICEILKIKGLIYWLKNLRDENHT